MIVRNKGYYLLTIAFSMALVSMPSHAWRGYGGGSGSATGRYGGSASWGGGSGSASSARGGSASWGGGSGSATGYRGGSASWSGGSGSATGAYGGSANWSHSYGGYHPPPAYGYHPPAYGYRPPPVYYGNTGYSSGQVAAAGVAGLAIGAMAGAAAASNSAPPPPTTVVVQQPAAPAPLSLGMSTSYLPGNCVNINLKSGQYYECGPNWFKPYFGSNGVYYQVVPAPY
jgi:hypothetical protein